MWWLWWSTEESCRLHRMDFKLGTWLFISCLCTHSRLKSKIYWTLSTDSSRTGTWFLLHYPFCTLQGNFPPSLFKTAFIHFLSGSDFLIRHRSAPPDHPIIICYLDVTLTLSSDHFLLLIYAYKMEFNFLNPWNTEYSQFGLWNMWDETPPKTMLISADSIICQKKTLIEMSFPLD